MPVFNDVVRLRCSGKKLLSVVNKISRNGIGTSTYKYNKYQGETNVIFTSSRLPGIGGVAEKDDTINNQLAELNRLVCQDAVKVKNIPKQIQAFETFIDNPNLDGEQDHYRSKAARKAYQLRIPEITLKEINDNFAKEGKRAISDIKGVIGDVPGKREFLLDYGPVEAG